MSIRPGSIVSVSCTSSRGVIIQSFCFRAVTSSLAARQWLSCVSHSSMPSTTLSARSNRLAKRNEAARCTPASDVLTATMRSGSKSRAAFKRKLPPDAAVDVHFVEDRDSRKRARDRRRRYRAIEHA